MKSPKQQRAVQTREIVMEAGRAAFAAKGFAGANLTTDILEPAGVSAGSFYHQFEDKTDLLIAVLDAAAERRKAWVLPPDLLQRAESLDAMITFSVHRFVQSLDDEGHDWRIQVRERTNPDPQVAARIAAGREAWRGYIGDAVGPYLPEGADLTQVTELMITFFVGLIGLYLDLPDDERARRRETLPDTVARFMLGGIRAVLDDA